VHESPEAAFSCVATIGLANVEVDVVQQIAQWVWYGEGAPDLGGIRGPFREDVLELLERLLQYQVVTPERRLELQNILKQECLNLTFDTKAFQLGYRRVLPQLQTIHAQAMMGRINSHIGARPPAR